MSENKNDVSFVEWIGFKKAPNFKKAKSLGIFVGTIITLLAVMIAIGGVATLGQFLALVFNKAVDHEAIRNLGLIVVATLGAPFVVWRATVAQKQADTAEQSHITDQINKSIVGLGAEKTSNKIGRPVTIYMGKSQKLTHLVESEEDFELKPRSLEIERYYDTSLVNPDSDEVFKGLHVVVGTWENVRTEIEWQGKPLQVEDGAAISKVGDWSVFTESMPNIEVRVGAIYALERIAQDSPRDHIQILEILTAYIRENAPVENLEPSSPPFKHPRPRTDVQAALNVIGRRAELLVAQERMVKYRLDLREVNLSGADFSKGNFEGSLLFNSRLEVSNFQSTNLRGARLQGCLLNYSRFFKADMQGAQIDRAIINQLGTWEGSITLAENMRGLSMAGADITAISHLPIKGTHSPTFGTKDTKLHEFLEEKRTERKKDINDFSYLTSGLEIQNEEEVSERLAKDGFLYWSPFESEDGSTSSARNKLWDDIGLKGFPYRD